MASTSVVGFANFVPIAEAPQGQAQEYNGDDTLIDENFRELAKEGITRENICILTEYSPALTDDNKRIIMQRYGDGEEARKRLIKINEFIENVVIDGYGFNDLDIPIIRIIAYIHYRLWHENAISILDIERLTRGTTQLSPEAEDNIIYIYGEERGIKRIKRINNFFSFLYENSTAHIFDRDDVDIIDPSGQQQVKLIPYEPSAQPHAVQQEKPQCTICFANEDDEDAAAKQKTLVSTPCNHIFHSACIEEWLKTHSTCPLCRRQF